MKKYLIKIILTNAIFYAFVLSGLFYAGYLAGNSEQPEECYFSGNARTMEEAELYTKLDEIIRSRQ